jgi:hypothetical protein
VRYIISIPLNFIPVVGTIFFLGFNGTFTVNTAPHVTYIPLLGAKSGPGYHSRYFQLKKWSEEQSKQHVAQHRGAYTRYV